MREVSCRCDTGKKTFCEMSQRRVNFRLPEQERVPMRFNNTRFQTALILWLTIGPRLGAANTNPEHIKTPGYPPARRLDIVDDFHGTKVADPYRWLEDGDSPETIAWAESESRLTKAYLAAIPGREQFKSRLMALGNYARQAAYQKINGRYFFMRNSGLQNQYVYYVADGLAWPPRVLLDPNQFRADGTRSVAGISLSPDARWMVYATSDAGSDWLEWHVRNVQTGEDLPDLIQWSKSRSIGWTADSRGFYYVRFPAPDPASKLQQANSHSKIYFHRLGDPSSRDRLVYERPGHPDWRFALDTTEDGRYLVVLVYSRDPRNCLVFYEDLSEPRPSMHELISEFQADYDFVGSEGERLYFRTTDGAPRGRIVSVDLARTDDARWREVIAQRGETLAEARYVDGKFVVSDLKDTYSQIRVYGKGGAFLREVALPMPGYVSLGISRQEDSEAFYTFENGITPRTTYRLDLRSLESSLVWRSKATLDLSRFELRQIFYTSKDGTRIPMSLAHRKGIPLDGRNPTLLTGYGGFGIVFTPQFNPMYAAWMEMGGVLAFANLRGGGEFGEQWHEAGKGARKQNVFDDFVAAAEWLIANRYTTPAKLAIKGESNGGLLVGAVMNQRPELFGAAVAGAGVMDMLRFQRFTVGAAWIGEYGSSDNPADFPTLLAYSPVHNVAPGASYPATLVMTADHDDRVVPGHSFKYTAALQAAQAGDAPILLRIETSAGHGAGTPISKLIEQFTDILAFLSRQLGMQAPE
jgi:prolyl oligopeptidase